MRYVFLTPFKDVPLEGEDRIFLTGKTNSSLIPQLVEVLSTFFKPTTPQEELTHSEIMNRVRSSDGSTFQVEFSPPEKYNRDFPAVVRMRQNDSVEGERYAYNFEGIFPADTSENIIRYVSSTTGMKVVTSKKIHLLETSPDKNLVDILPDTVNVRQARQAMKILSKGMYMYTFPVTENGYLNPLFHTSLIDVGVTNDLGTSDLKFIPEIAKKVIAGKIKSTDLAQEKYRGYSKRQIEALISGEYYIVAGGDLFSLGGLFGAWASVPFHNVANENLKILESAAKVMLINRDLGGAMLGIATFSSMNNYMAWYMAFVDILKSRGESAISSHLSGLQVVLESSIPSGMSKLFSMSTESMVLGKFPVSDMVR